MDRLQTLRSFCSVAETQSFSESARLHGVSAALISRHISDLEQHLGARLFNRTTRHVALTDAGQHFYQDSLRLLEQLEAAEARVRGTEGQPQGLLRISVPMDFGRLFLGPALREFLSRAPEVRIDVLYEDRDARLPEEQVDVAVRIGRLDDSSLVARRLGTACLGCYASADYLVQQGAPEQPIDLEQHQLLNYSLSRHPGQWTFESANGKERIALAGRWRLSCNNGRVLADAACRGLGIARLPEFLVADHLLSGNLHEVLKDFRSEPLEISAVSQSRQYRPAKIEAFLDFLVDYFARQDNWQPRTLTPAH